MKFRVVGGDVLGTGFGLVFGIIIVVVSVFGVVFNGYGFWIDVILRVECFFFLIFEYVPLSFSFPVVYLSFLSMQLLLVLLLLFGWVNECM